MGIGQASLVWGGAAFALPFALQRYNPERARMRCHVGTSRVLCVRTWPCLVGLLADMIGVTCGFIAARSFPTRRSWLATKQHIYLALFGPTAFFPNHSLERISFQFFPACPRGQHQLRARVSRMPQQVRPSRQPVATRDPIQSGLSHVGVRVLSYCKLGCKASCLGLCVLRYLA